jgi:hypothetical protein
MGRKRLLTALAGVLVVAAVAGGLAYAAIPGSGGVCRACLLTAATIRVIGAQEGEVAR